MDEAAPSLVTTGKPANVSLQFCRIVSGFPGPFEKAVLQAYFAY